MCSIFLLDIYCLFYLKLSYFNYVKKILLRTLDVVNISSKDMSTISHVNKYLFSIIIVKFVHSKYKIVLVLDIYFPDDYFPVCHLQCESNTFLSNSVRYSKEHCFVLRFPDFVSSSF